MKRWITGFLAILAIASPAWAADKLKVETLWPSSSGYVAVIVSGLPSGKDVRFRCAVRSADGTVLGADEGYGSGVAVRGLVRVQDGREGEAASAECWLAE